MNSKITLPALVALLSEKSGIQKKQCEEFIKEFFSLVTSTLEEGENVKIKGFGTFKVISVETRKSVNVSDGRDITIPGHKKIVFVPARELADEVNAPFSMFDSVELAPGVEEEMEIESETELVDVEKAEEKYEELPESDELRHIEQQAPAVPLYNIEEDSEREGVASDIAENVESLRPEDYVSDESEHREESPDGLAEDMEDVAEKVAHEAVVENEKEENAALARSTEEIVEEVPEAEESDSAVSAEYPVLGYAHINEKRPGRFKFLIGFACGLALAIVMCLGGYWYFLHNTRVAPRTLNTNVEETVIAAKEAILPASGESAVADNNGMSAASAESRENIDEAKDYPATKPSDAPVYDTIGDHRYLTTMAKDHYGNYNLWPYIYEENKSYLGHPDRIKPGTQVVIPALSKYGVNPNNPEDIKKAKKMGIEIYARYK